MSARPDVPPILGGRYRLHEILGTGAMAVVYRATDLEGDIEVAVKVLKSDLAATMAEERFLQEIEFSSRLKHPNILPVLDWGRDGGCLFLVMPLVRGDTLKDRLHEEGALPIPAAVSIALDIARALSAAHAAGIIHRDITPANTLLEGDRAVLADFGIARAIGAAGGHTETGIALGTPPYMSPEQGGGDNRILDGRSDIYSLGCLLYEMLTGDPPFRASDSRAVIAMHMAQPVPDPRTVRPGVTADIVHLVQTALRKSPADRFESADELVTALEHPDTVARPEGPDLVVLEPTPVSRWRVRLAAGVVAILAGVAAYTLWPRPPALDGSKVVVFPLVESGAGVQGDGWSAALAIESAMEHAQPLLRWRDGWQWLTDEQRANAGRLSDGDARSISRGQGAAYYLTGFVRAESGERAVTLVLHHTDGDSIVAQRTSAGPAGQVAVTALDAVRSLLPSIGDPGRSVDLAPIRERSPAAIALWIDGEREYRQSRFRAALVRYRQAIEADSALAFAAVKGAQAASWEARLPEAVDLVSVALRNVDRLPPKYAFFARGLWGYLTGHADSAVAELQRAIDEDPEWSEAHMALGEVYRHLMPGLPSLDSLAPLEFARAAALDSGFAAPLFHLSEERILTGDTEEAARLIALQRSFDPDAALETHLDLGLACVERGPENVDWPLELRSDSMAVFRAGTMLWPRGLQLDCAEAAFRALIGDGVALPGWRWAGLTGLHGSLMARGDVGEAAALVDSATDAGTSRGLFLHILSAMAQPGELTRSKGEAVEAFAKDLLGARYERLRGPETLWLMGVWHAAKGEGALVEGLARVAREVADSSGGRRDRLFADALSAHAALARGDTSAAIERFSTLRPTAPRDSLEWEVGESLPVERWVLARLYLARGEYDLAREVASSFDHPAPIMNLMFLPGSLAVRLRAADAVGDRRASARFRARLTALGRVDLIENVP